MRTALRGSVGDGGKSGVVGVSPCRLIFLGSDAGGSLGTRVNKAR